MIRHTSQIRDHVRPAPDWLRDAMTLADLPRADPSLAANQFPFSTDGMSDADIAKMIVWIVETLAYGWWVTALSFRFQRGTDATILRLKWMGRLRSP